MQLDLIVNILPIFKKGGQELKAHLSIKSTNGNATHNSIVSNNVMFVSFFPLGSAAPGACNDSLMIVSIVCFFFYSYLLFTTFIVSRFYLFACKVNAN